MQHNILLPSYNKDRFNGGGEAEHPLYGTDRVG
jgi:hypothetical protein